MQENLRREEDEPVDREVEFDCLLRLTLRSATELAH
jgi:hypothetical protein